LGGLGFSLSEPESGSGQPTTRIFIAAGLPPALAAAFCSQEMAVELLQRTSDTSSFDARELSENSWGDILFGLSLARRDPRQVEMLNHIEHNGIIDSVNYEHYAGAFEAGRECARGSADAAGREPEAARRLRGLLPRGAAITPRHQAGLRAGELYELGERLAREFQEPDPRASATLYAYRILRTVWQLDPGASWERRLDTALRALRHAQRHPAPADAKARLLAIISRVRGVMPDVAEAVASTLDPDASAGPAAMVPLLTAIERLREAARPLRPLLARYGEGVFPFFYRSLVHGALQMGDGSFFRGTSRGH